MNVKRGIAAATLIVLLAGGGHYLLEKNNPYNNKNITFIHQHLDKFSDTMEDFIEEDFKEFNSMMKDLSNGNYDKFAKSDMTILDEYMNVILSCNFSSYEAQPLVDRQKSGFLINFENYFKKGTEEYNLVKWASEQYQEVIKRTYKSGDPKFEKMAEDCGLEYNIYKSRIDKLSPFARYVVLKLIRPILDINYYNDLPYALSNKKSYYAPLQKIDEAIDNCLQEMENQCKNTYYGYSH